MPGGEPVKWVGSDKNLSTEDTEEHRVKAASPDDIMAA